MAQYLRVFSGALSFLACTALFALDSVEERLRALEQEMQQVSVENSVGTLGALFAAAPSAYEYFFDAEVLLWHAKQGE